MLLLMMMPKEICGTEYIYLQPTNLSKINKDASSITFANFSLGNVPTSAFSHLYGCKTLTFINTKTIKIDQDAWLGLSKLESLSIENSFMTALDTDRFAHLKSLTMLKVTTVRSAELQYFPKDSVPIKPAAFRGLDSLNHLWLSMPNLNESTFQNMDSDTWGDIANTLTELIMPENEFTKLHDDMFIQFLDLEKLSFPHNRIRTVSSKAFIRLEFLTEIDLSQNKIKDITNDMFQTLTSLSEINLSDNEVEHLADNLFKGLRQLRIIKLNNNRLKTFGCNVFDPMDFISTGGHPGKITILLFTLCLPHRFEIFISFPDENPIVSISVLELVSWLQIHMKYETIIKYQCVSCCSLNFI